MSPSAIRQLLATRNLRPLKQLGQNFLHDANHCDTLADEIIEAAADAPRLLELGPGLGAITGRVLERASVPLHVIEIDKGLAAYLREAYAEAIAAGRLVLHEGDALKEMPALWQTWKNDAPTMLFGNLPYNISTPLIMTVLREALPPRAMIFTLQKEMGQRLAAVYKTKAYGQLTVLVQADYEVELLRLLPGSVFFPEPEVESAMVRLVRRPEPLVAPDKRKAFAAAVKRGFSQRRKKLSNLLPTTDERRAEHLTVEEWVKLAEDVTT